MPPQSVAPVCPAPSRPATCPALLLLLGTLCFPGRALVSQSEAPSVVSLDSLLDTRVSTAAKYSQRISEVAASVTIVTSEDIERFGYRTLDQVLATVPGFYLSNDRDYTSVGNRGFGRPTDHNNRILLLVDGNTVNESVFGSAPIGSELPIPMQSLERIEIIRGPGSALYGTGAVFGVVNLITRSGAAIDGAKIQARGGSYGQRGVEGLFGRRTRGGVDILLSGLLDRSEGQDLYYPAFDSTYQGIAKNLDGEERLGLVASLDAGAFSLHGRYATRRKEVPTAPYRSLFGVPGAFTWDQYASVELGFDQDLDARRHLVSRVYYNHYRDNSDFPFPDSLGNNQPLTAATGEEVMGAEARLRWDLGSANRLTVGGEFRRSFTAGLVSPRESPHTNIDLNGPMSSLSGYIQDEYQFSRATSLLAGLRYDAYSNVNHNPLSPRLGLLVRPTRTTTLKLLYGEAFRAPSVYETGISGIPFIPNPNLRPERIRTLELVWQQRLGGSLLWSTSVSRYRMRDLIDLTFDPGTGYLQFQNVNRVKSLGVESGLDVRLGADLAGFASYSWQRTIDALTQDRLTNSPAHLAKGGLSLVAAPWFRPAITARYESSRKTARGSHTGAFFLTDLNLRVLPLPASSDRQFELGLRINNLLDAAYASPGGAELLQSSIPQDGRTLSAELRFGF